MSEKKITESIFKGKVIVDEGRLREILRKKAESETDDMLVYAGIIGKDIIYLTKEGSDE